MCVGTGVDNLLVIELHCDEAQLIIYIPGAFLHNNFLPISHENASEGVYAITMRLCESQQVEAYEDPLTPKSYLLALQNVARENDKHVMLLSVEIPRKVSIKSPARFWSTQ